MLLYDPTLSTVMKVHVVMSALLPVSYEEVFFRCDVMIRILQIFLQSRLVLTLNPILQYVMTDFLDKTIRADDCEHCQ